MATIAEKEKLIETLKFVPCTYTIEIWGYGGEYTWGKVPRETAEWHIENDTDMVEFCHDCNGDLDIPNEHRFITDGAWHECDDLGHIYGPSMNASILTVSNENGEEVFRADLGKNENIDDIEFEEENEHFYENDDNHIVFECCSGEKGTFMNVDLPLTAPFDPTKLIVKYDDIGNDQIITSVEYDGETYEIEANTDGKSFEANFVDD